MQSLRSHFLRHKLLVLSGSKTFAGARSLISSIGTCSSSLLNPPVHFRSNSFHSRDRRWEEESRDSPASREGEEVHKSSTYFDPLEAKIKAMPVVDERDDSGGEAEESINTMSAAKVSSSSQKRSCQETHENEHNSLSFAGVKRKSGKTKTTWFCENCGDIQAKWWGTCPNCEVVGKFKCFVESEVSKSRGAEISEALVSSWLPQELKKSAPISLAKVRTGTDQSKWRIPLEGQFGLEFCRVLGGGIVPGSLVLIGGDPGVGKSTLLLQIAAIVARGFNHKGPAPVVYASGEESIEQIGSRAQRMRITTKELFLYSNTDIEDILDKITKLSPRALIVDSIQTVYLKGVTGSAGSVMQIKECTSALLRFAKQTNIPVFLSGHVTKSGDIAGPRILEHIVDAVFYMEGDRHTSYRLVRSVKNRFGSTDELGVFEMSESGLQAVTNPSEIFLSEKFSDSDVLVGRAISVSLDGSRIFLNEIQALCVSNCPVKRHFNGIEDGKASMIISVLMKQAGLKLDNNFIFLNVVGGFKLSETAGDLAIAIAISSSFLEFPIPNNVVFIGEVGLGGELRSVPRMDKRLMAVSQLGYKRCIIPETANKLLKALNLEIEVVCCRNLKEVINFVFRSES